MSKQISNLISIIVPCFNVQSIVKRCIENLLAQTYTDFELILINDGSKDGTAEILDYYKSIDSRIQVIHKSNGGVSSARNAGLEIAKGKYIAFSDADDEIKPDWLDNFIEIIGNSDLAIQGIEFIDLNSTDKSIGNLSGKDKKVLVEILIKEGYLGYLVGKFFRRDIINDHTIRLKEDIRFREDDIFVLSYILHVNSWVSTLDYCSFD